jgi:hypothetical protein
MMRAKMSTWALISLCLSMAAAVGGGLYEHIVLMPLWSRSPPSSFSIVQPQTGVPLQRFWIPVHIAITVFALVALLTAWRDRPVRRALLVGLGSYVVMRAWSGVFFIPEMLAFQQVPLDSPASPELIARVESWTRWSWWREPLDVVSFLAFLLAFARSRTRPD